MLLFVRMGNLPAMNEKWMKMRQSQEEGDFSSPTAKKEKYVCFHNINQTLPALMTKGKQKKKFLTDYHLLIENTEDKKECIARLGTEKEESSLGFPGWKWEVNCKEWIFSLLSGSCMGSLEHVPI